MSKLSSAVLSDICSAIEYLIDRGEFEVDGDSEVEVETPVRYRDNQINGMILKIGTKRVRITAEEIT